MWDRQENKLLDLNCFGYKGELHLHVIKLNFQLKKYLIFVTDNFEILKFKLCRTIIKSNKISSHFNITGIGN